MPTIFSHAVFAVVAGKAAVSKTQKIYFWLLAGLCAIIPDADVIGYWLGVERGGMFAHRGLTHSIAFALVFGAFAAFVARKYLRTGISFFKLFVFFALATFSHPLLDMLTDGGSGAALLAPLTNERFFFPWRPIEVSPIGLRFFGSRGVEVILSEMLWVWLPAFLIYIAAKLIRKRR